MARFNGKQITLEQFEGWQKAFAEALSTLSGVLKIILTPEEVVILNEAASSEGYPPSDLLFITVDLCLVSGGRNPAMQSYTYILLENELQEFCMVLPDISG